MKSIAKFFGFVPQSDVVYARTEGELRGRSIHSSELKRAQEDAHSALVRAEKAEKLVVENSKAEAVYAAFKVIHSAMTGGDESEISRRRVALDASAQAMAAARNFYGQSNLYGMAALGNIFR